jgi:Family of unknown function (DUF5683)
MTRTRLVLVLALTALAWNSAAADDGPPRKLTIPRTDVLYLSFGNGSTNPLLVSGAAKGGARSVPKAFALSAVVPGLGQAYNRSWWKVGVAVAAEAALITAYFSWKNKGNDGERGYKAFAHQNWSPIKYAEWLNAYSGYTGSDVPLPSLTDAEFMHPETWTAAQRTEVDAFFNEIRAAERQSSFVETGASFSHVLPYFGEQQYYELIGKYFQFAPGWDDYNYAPDADPEIVMSKDAHFYYYAHIHAKANDYLRRSRWAGAFIIVNHFAAAVDAAISARRHNLSLHPTTAMVTGPFGEPVVTTGLRLDL